MDYLHYGESKPTTRLDSFEDALKRIRIKLEQPVKPVTLEDIQAIVSDQTMKQKSKMRLSKMLNPLQQYTEVFKALGQNSDAASYVWGPLKLVFEMAAKNATQIDTIADAFEQIASEIPKMNRYVKLFSNDSELQSLVMGSYRVILDFLDFTIDYCATRKPWQSSSTTAKFKEKLQDVLKNLHHHKSLIESRAVLAEMEQNKASREESRQILTTQISMSQEAQDLQRQQLHILRSQLQAAHEAEEKRQIATIIEMISPASVDVDQWNGAKAWRQNPQLSVPLWLFQHLMMLKWLDSENKEDCILHLKALPGAGKTVLASKIINTLMSDETIWERKSLFFYFKQEDPSRNSLNALLKGLLSQLLQMRLVGVGKIYHELSTSSKLELQSLDTLMRFVETVLEECPTLWLVLDGIDECSRKERKRIITWILRSSNDPDTAKMRVLFISQDEGDLRTLLTGVPSISLIEQPGHLGDIREFTSRKADKLREKFDLKEEHTTEIIEKVVRNANGTFLYAKLVLKYLKNQESRTQFDKQFHDSRFPIGLDDLAQKLHDCQALTGKGILNIDLATANRCLVEAVASVRRKQGDDSQSDKILAIRKLPRTCLTCHLFGFEEHAITIPLDKLLYSSISCHVCHTLCKAIILLDHDWLEKAHGSSVLNIERSQGSLCFRVQALEARSGVSGGGEESKWGFPMILHIFTDQLLESVWSGLQVHQPIFSDPGSEECIRKIGGWLNACENEHLRCLRAPKALQSNAFGLLTVKRVIDLGAPGNIYPRLVSTGSIVRRWTALSYCWGGRSSFVTTKANVEQREQSIPWASIPATFKDAMTLTHRLGIRYIWIDALCIIQDSQEDWLAEAEKMGNVYQDARFVIAADWAPNSDSGIFSTRQRHSLAIDVDLSNSQTSHGRQKIFVERGSSQDFTSNQSEPSQWHTGAFLRHSVLESNSRALNKRWLNPTLRRAWCFQERLLATRILHFTAAELIWECKTKIDCECGIRQSSGHTLKQNLDNTLERLAAPDHAHLASSRVTASKMWWNLVTEYSWCSLTFRSDRLPAISAMARLFPTLGTYWEGMWRQELPLSLLWKEEFVEDPGIQLPLENGQSIAPSWSWASALYPIQEPDWSHDQATAEVIDIPAPPSADSKTYGQISNRSLHLKGPVLNGILRYITDSWFKKPVIQLQIVLDDGSIAPGMDFESSKLRFHKDHGLKFDEKHGGIAEMNVVLLAIKSSISAEHGRVFDCLVLRSSAHEDTKESPYIRVGTATCIDSSVDSKSMFGRVSEVKIV